MINCLGVGLGRGGWYNSRVGKPAIMVFQWNGWNCNSGCDVMIEVLRWGGRRDIRKQGQWTGTLTPELIFQVINDHY